MATTRRAVVTSATGLGLVMLDNTAMTLAVPAIAQSLDAAVADLQWLLSTPPLAAAVLLPLAGALGDRYGARHVMRAGLLIFALGSIGVAVSPNVATLLTARAVQGCGQALVLPNGAALLAANIPDTSRARAIGSWIAVSSLGLVVGPVGGGLAIQHLGWRWLLTGHVVIAIAGVLGVMGLRDSKHRSPHPVDVPGVVLGGTALYFTCFGFIELGRGSGRTILALPALALGAATAVAFVAVQRRRAHPLVDLSMIRNPQFATVLGAAVAYNAAISGTAFVLSLMMQNARGEEPFTAGLILLGATIGMPLGAQLAGLLGARRGLRVVMATATVLLGVAYAAVAGLALAPLAALLVPLLLTGFSSGTLFAADTQATLSVVAPDKVSSGLASVSLARQVGSLLGIAGLGTLSQALTASSDPTGARVAMAVAGLAMLPSGLLLWRNIPALRRAATVPGEVSPARSG